MQKYEYIKREKEENWSWSFNKKKETHINFYTIVLLSLIIFTVSFIVK